MRVLCTRSGHVRLLLLSGMLLSFLAGCDSGSGSKSPPLSSSDPKAAARRKDQADFFSKNPPPGEKK